MNATIIPDGTRTKTKTCLTKWSWSLPLCYEFSVRPSILSPSITHHTPFRSGKFTLFFPCTPQLHPLMVTPLKQTLLDLTLKIKASLRTLKIASTESDAPKPICNNVKASLVNALWAQTFLSSTILPSIEYSELEQYNEVSCLASSWMKHNPILQKKSRTGYCQTCKASEGGSIRIKKSTSANKSSL